MADLLYLGGSVNFGCLILLLVNAGNGRQIDDCAPADLLPDLTDDINGSEKFRLLQERNPCPAKKAITSLIKPSDKVK